MDLPTTRQLECLVAVSKRLHFSQAAELWHITQPAFSAQIQQLETLLGVRLFERDRRRVLPTAAGAQLAEQVDAHGERRLRQIPFSGKKPARTIGLAWRASSLRRAEFEQLARTIAAAVA